MMMNRLPAERSQHLPSHLLASPLPSKVAASYPNSHWLHLPSLSMSKLADALEEFYTQKDLPELLDNSLSLAKR